MRIFRADSARRLRALAATHVMAQLESSKLSGFLQKPYGAPALLEMVRRVLEAPLSPP